MDTIIEVCAGLDVHKETVTANVRYRDERGRRRATARPVGTTTAELLEMSDWLGELGVTHVANAGEVLTMLLGVIGAGLIGLRDVSGEVAVPLLATHILWINLLTDTAPALAMGVDPSSDDVMSRPPRRPTDR